METKKYKIAVVGATGLVGNKMLEVLEERNFLVSELIPAASEKSIGKAVHFQGKEWKIVSLAQAVEMKPQIAIFSAGATVSREWAPRFAAAGCYVVDNSSCWRMDSAKRLIVPEVNGDLIPSLSSTDSSIDNHIIANPNCSTIQMLVALWPLHKRYGIKRIVVSTYQSVTGSGLKGIAQLQRERSAATSTPCEERYLSTPQAYPHPIDLNILPHIDVFMDNGNTKEEMKMIEETWKIFNDYSIGISATTVRVPVMGGHSESVNVELNNPFEIEDIIKELRQAPGVVVMDNPSDNLYPTPIECTGRDEVFVGRIRRDSSLPNALNLWVVSDNLRKGAATNAVQIAERMILNSNKMQY